MSVEVQKNKYKSVLDYGYFSTPSIFKLFTEYFNAISKDEKKNNSGATKLFGNCENWKMFKIKEV